MYVYLQSEKGYGYDLFTVGFYDPSGQWHPDSDFNFREDAANRVIELNGGAKAPPIRVYKRPTAEELENDF